MAEQLTKQQVEEVLEFAQGLWSGENLGYYSPFMSNQNLQDLNNNALVPTSEKIRAALADYKNSAENLQSYVEFMQCFDMIFARTFQSYANILAFDLQIIPANAFTQSDIESSEYQADKERVYKFLRSFNYVDEFRRVVAQVLRGETYYTWMRRTKWGNKGMKCTLQVMPQKFCMTTGYWEKGLLYDFDAGYFLRAGVDIDGFDPVFKKYYNKVFGDKAGDFKYRPTTPLDRRDGYFSFWVQTSPMDGAWAFKQNRDNFNNTPFLAPYLKDVITTEEIGQLQYDKDMLSAYAILAGEIQLFDNAKSGTVANQFAISPKTLGQFMGKVKAGLDKRVKAVAVPLKNIDMYQYNDSDKDMYSNQLANSAGTGSSVSRIIYSTDRMSNAELQFATEADYHIMQKLYPQFENFLEFWANRLTSKYKFKFVFDGCNFEYDRANRFERLMKMADKGIVLNSSAYASVLGMKPQDFDASLLEGKYGGMIDKLSLLLNTNTTKDGSSTGGRPQISGTELTDSGETSRESL